VHRLLEKQEIICWESDGVSDSCARRRLETEHRGAKTDRILLQDTWEIYYIEQRRCMTQHRIELKKCFQKHRAESITARDSRSLCDSAPTKTLCLRDLTAEKDSRVRII